MPRKKKKLKKQPPTIECELFFSDVTIDQTQGEYKKVRHLMETDDVNNTFFIIKNGRAEKIKSVSINRDWCVKSNLTLQSPTTEGSYIIDFFHDKNVFIVAYNGLFDPMVNADVRLFSAWCQKMGWHIPQVSPAVARENLFFWKSIWETMLIDSDFFEEKYGKRKTSEMLKNQPEDDDDIDF